MSEAEKPGTGQRQSLLRVFGSVLASMFGVQSSRKHQEDFGQGKAATYIVVGLIATVLFVLAVWGAVQLVVHFAQPG